ncbi:MAG TPA: hypothetical protein PLP48_07660 [Acholeplasmataceae bacterium]|nr:hypothetical protein [Acholeplasmataceae bacterium]
MTFIKDNFEIIMIIMFIASFVLLTIILSMNKYFALYFSNKRFKIHSHYEVNAYDGRRDFTITIFNNNINEVRLSGFGFVYKDQNIDFYKNYLLDHALPSDHKLVIHSRDYLTSRIDVNQLKSIISDINKGSLDVSSMKTFVTDSLGLSVTAKAKQVKDEVRKMLKIDRDNLRKQHKEQIRKKRADDALFRKKNKMEKQIKLRDKTGRILLKIKGLFSKKH